MSRRDDDAFNDFIARHEAAKVPPRLVTLPSFELPRHLPYVLVKVSFVQSSTDPIGRNTVELHQRRAGDWPLFVVGPLGEILPPHVPGGDE